LQYDYSHSEALNMQTGYRHLVEIQPTNYTKVNIN